MDDERCRSGGRHHQRRAETDTGYRHTRRDEVSRGCARLRRKIRRYRPAVVALVGVTVFRALFPDRKGPVPLGLQQERIGESVVFVLPNPSGRNANYSYAEMRRAFRALARSRSNRSGAIGV